MREEISILGPCLTQEINSKTQHIKMCVISEKGAATFTGDFKKAIYVKEHEAILAKHKEALKIALEALEFYADKDTYGCEDTSRTTGNKVYDVVCFDFERNLSGKDFAGKRARKAKQKIEEILTKENEDDKQ